MQCGGECLGWQADGGGGEAVGSGTRGTPSEDPGSPGAGGRDGRCLGGWWSRLGGCAFLTTAAVQLVGGGVSFSCPILARHLLTSFNGTTPAEAGWMVGVSWLCVGLFSPVIAAVSVRYGSARSLCVLGGFVAGLGALFTSFSQRLLHVLVSWSFIASSGIGIALTASWIGLLAVRSGSLTLWRTAVLVALRYAGLALSAYFIDARVTSEGWPHGVQTSVSIVCLVFLLSAFLSIPDYKYDLFSLACRRVKGGKESFLPDLATAVDTYLFRDLCYVYWILLETAMSSALAGAITLYIVSLQMGVDAGDAGSRFSLVVLGAAGGTGALLWCIPYRWCSLPHTFLIQQTTLLAAVVTAAMTVVCSGYGALVTAALLGLAIGGLDVFCARQLARLFIPEEAVSVYAWSTFFKGVGAAFGVPVIMMLEGAVSALQLGFGVVSALLLALALTWWGVMRVFRLRELDLWGQQQPVRAFRLCPVSAKSSFSTTSRSLLTPRSSSTAEASTSTGGTGGEGTRSSGRASIEDNPVLLELIPDLAAHQLFDPEILWRDEAYRDMLVHGSFVGVGGGGGTGAGEDGVPPAGIDEPGTGEFRRRRTIAAEPTMPILPECPSQENSSVSRMDLSVHSGRDNDTETLHSQNTSRKGSSAFHSSYTLSRSDAPDIIIENYNIEEALDRLSNRRHDSVSSKDASTSTANNHHPFQNDFLPPVPSSSHAVDSTCASGEPAVRASQPSAADIVNGLVDINADIKYIDADSNGQSLILDDDDIEESYSSSELAGSPYYESTV